MTDHDVIIVGAGPVGLLLACQLAQRGIDVVVYEKRPGPDERSRAIGIHPPGRDALEAVGLGALLRAEALALDGGEVVCGGRILASVDFTAQRRVLILPQSRTDALLRQRLAALQPGSLRSASVVRGVHDDGRTVRVAVDADGNVERVTAAFVVAADGVHSGIRRALGVRWRSRPGKSSYVMMDIPDASDTARARLHCESSGLVESFPLPGGRRRWVLADRDRTVKTADEFTDGIEARTGIRLDVTDGATPTPFRAQQHRASRGSVGRVALVGDAAHETSPIGGQGMNLGWAAASRLAAALEVSLLEGRPRFDAYGGVMLRAAARAQQRSAFYMAMGSPATGPALGARNSLIRLLGTSPLRDRTAGMITMRGL